MRSSRRGYRQGPAEAGRYERVRSVRLQPDHSIRLKVETQVRVDHRFATSRDQVFARLSRFREEFLPVTPLPEVRDTASESGRRSRTFRRRALGQPLVQHRRLCGCGSVHDRQQLAQPDSRAWLSQSRSRRDPPDLPAGEQVARAARGSVQRHQHGAARRAERHGGSGRVRHYHLGRRSTGRSAGDQISLLNGLNAGQCGKIVDDAGVIMRISARNSFKGTVTALNNGPVSTEVTIRIAPKIEIVSVITTRPRPTGFDPQARRR